MDNAEVYMHSLEEFSKFKPKDIPRELEDYLGYVAKTGDPVFKWSIIKCLFREKLLNVITDFYESTLSIELPPCPNVEAFNYERMKANLLDKIDTFNSAPFTVQRISELLTNPWKEYNRADKFMRAIEKNILVVSTGEPGRYAENEVEMQQEFLNGIPEANDSGIESFKCINIANHNSPSYNFDKSPEFQPTLMTNVTSNSANSVLLKDYTWDIRDAVCSNRIDLIRNNKVNQEIVIEEKGNETVICSTINKQVTESRDLHRESAFLFGETEAIDPSMDTESSLDVLEDSNSSSEFGNGSKEARLEVSGTETIDCLQVDKTKSMSVTERNNSSEYAETVSNSQDNNTEGFESSASWVVKERPPIECDTANNMDYENSYSCDTKEESKQPVDEQLSSGIECKVYSSSDYETASVFKHLPCEVAKSEESVEASYPSTSTISFDPSEMDVGECQISHIVQSQS